MRAFVPAGTKFNAHGFTWVASAERSKNWGTAFAEKYQVWVCKKTWLHLTCRYDIRKEKLTWQVSRFDTSVTRSGAASMAASMTRESLDAYVDRLALYGDEVEKRYAKMILKKKKHVVIPDAKPEEIQF